MTLASIETEYPPPAPRQITAADGFAGPGGWSLALQLLGVQEKGIEYDDAANATRRTCGYATIEDDILNVTPFSAELLIMSPSCQSFSTAGKGAGRKALDQVLADVQAIAEGADFKPDSYDDVRTALVLIPLVWVLRMHQAGTPYRHLAFEQVPPVKPVWEAMLAVFEKLGYRGEVGLLQAEAYGVPQTRKRAILVASLDKRATLPAPRTPSTTPAARRSWMRA
ncbi:DNA cytosine methyltransferase [Nesterenkonia rhizosphaerae]|uniref:DNA (cytosine-5-)-methyltransferase n=1 Tax=Nesterenkonia rhizosphaerae TaxID=1348272 RepID=A0ABP9G0T4_9MICC